MSHHHKCFWCGSSIECVREECDPRLVVTCTDCGTGEMDPIETLVDPDVLMDVVKEHPPWAQLLAFGNFDADDPELS